MNLEILSLAIRLWAQNHLEKSFFVQFISTRPLSYELPSSFMFKEARIQHNYRCKLPQNGREYLSLYLTRINHTSVILHFCFATNKQ